MLSTPIEHFPASFLGLTVQPCGEPYGSAAGIGFLTVRVIQIQKNEQVLLSSEIYARGSYQKTSQTSAGQSSMGVDSIPWQYGKYLKQNLNIKNIAKFFC
jgi:hypothetical protein